MNKEQLKSRPVRGANREIYPREMHLYTRVLEAMLQDVATHCTTYTAKEAARDLQEIENRVAKEGIEFLTKTLPTFAKALDRALASDTKFTVPGFKKAKGSSLPLFLRGLTSLVFSSACYERSDASVDAVRSIRQIGYCFYKLRLPFDENQIQKVISAFIETDDTLDNDVPADLDHVSSWILSYAQDTIHRILAGKDPKEGFNPKHGPGAVATGEKVWQKMNFKRYYPSLAREFPYDEHFYYNHSHFCDDLDRFTSLEEREHPTAKVVMVPKDSRGPRLISMEPLEIQWIQQGLKRNLESAIEQSEISGGLVNFRNQQINRYHALVGSLYGDSVTLDMKDASDRVPTWMVKALFPDNWVGPLLAARSTHTKLPDGRVMPLKKYAPMGSALCFPVESLIFWALARSSIAYTYKSDRRMLELIRGSALERHPGYDGRVYVYGDDIICPWIDYSWVMERLSLFGLRFNTDKCCTGSSFRESCGMDAFKGHPVTPVRIQARWTSSLRGMEYPSWVSYANSLLNNGFSHTADLIIGEIQKIKRTPYSDSYGGCGVITLCDPREMAWRHNKKWNIKTRYHSDHDIHLKRGWHVSARISNDTSTPGWSELLRLHTLKTKEFEVNKVPVGRPLPWHPPRIPEWEELSDDKVRAYRYALPRQAVLRRGWAQV
jgi:hypothetical protein